jgi:hypothetical protein
MTTALRRHLILDVDSRNVSRFVLPYGTGDVQLVPVPGIGIGNDGNIDRACKDCCVRNHFGHGDQTVVGIAERSRRAGPGHVHGRETDMLHHPRGHTVIGAGRNDDILVSQQLPQSRRCFHV